MGAGVHRVRADLVIDVVADTYDWPHPAMHPVFGVLVGGFVVTLLLAWYHGERDA
jgi:hypothetical protein